MYKSILLIFILHILRLSINAQNSENDFFEGEVHFKVTSESLDNRFTNDFFTAMNGSQMIGKVKRDKYVMHQNTNGSLGETKIVILLKEGIAYLEFENSDTITQRSIENNFDKLIDKKVNLDDKKVILGDSCSSISFKYIPSVSYGIIEYVDAKYYFNPKYRLDQSMYKNHNMSFWNLFVEMGNGSMSVRNEIINHPFYKSTYELIKIERKEIPDSEFNIDTSKIIIKEY